MPHLKLWFLPKIACWNYFFRFWCPKLLQCKHTDKISYKWSTYTIFTHKLRFWLVNPKNQANKCHFFMHKFTIFWHWSTLPNLELCFSSNKSLINLRKQATSENLKVNKFWGKKTNAYFKFQKYKKNDAYHYTTTTPWSWNKFYP